MSDPDQITVTLSREEAVELYEGPALADDGWYPVKKALLDALEAALQNPQPSDTGRYEEALRERLTSDAAILAGARKVNYASSKKRMVAKDVIEAALDAAFQPTGEKHGE